MEHQYQHFGPLDENSVFGRNSVAAQTGLKRIVVYILYSILVLLLLIHLMVTGIKFTQLNKEMTDIKVQLNIIKNERTSSSSGAKQGAPQVKEAFLKEIVPIRGLCSEGWASFQGSCYWLSGTTATWKKAEELCTSHRGHLLVLNSAEELDFISQIVVVTFHYWIGLVEPHHEGEWTWVDGTDFSSTPTFWAEGQPDNWDFRENGEDCGQLQASVKRIRKLWNDADCNLSYRFICEAKA